VEPQDWDLLVVGGGTAGIVGAKTAASFGARVLLVERERTGGDCLWTGCVPSKSLLAAAAAAADDCVPYLALADLQLRWARGVRLEEPVFSNSLGGLRDPKNTRRDVRAALDRAGFEWVTSNSFRKTTAMMLDEAGLSARVIADQLGHARPSMTQDVYIGRKAVDARVAAALEGALGKTPPNEPPAKKSK
jgi:glycine/D-amino acid oxidase-like deaminating enzyme